MDRLSFEEMLEDSNQRESKVYKWVRVITNTGSEFRFIHLVWHENHGMLVDEGEKADSAGTIGVNCDFWRVSTGGWGSTTLKIGCDEEAAQALESIFEAAGRPEKERW